MFLENMDEDTVYEVLISSRSADGKFNINVFGMCFDGENILLKLYPNRTLFNIKSTSSFVIHFTQDVLLYTGAVMGLLDEKSLSLMDCSVCCEVLDFHAMEINDALGKNIITEIIAKPVKIIENKTIPPIINRSTNKIIELLVEYSRYEYMNIDTRKEFHKKIAETEKFIQKNGNKKHKKSIKKIKEKISLHD